MLRKVKAEWFLCRKSTVGFNIGQMILDLAGGILSLAQLALEAIVLKDITVITGHSSCSCLHARRIAQILDQDLSSAQQI